MVYCSFCHQYLAEGTANCPSCGRHIVAAATGVTTRLEPPPLPSAAPPACARCGAAMEQGFVLDHDHGYSNQENWVAGPSERDVWFGGVKTAGRKVYPVRTYRCTRCGYLESYALPNDPQR